jgi:hypothetical protein
MSNWKTLIALALVVLSAAACGDEPTCPAGSEKRGGVCIQEAPVQAGDAGSAVDAAADAEADGSADCPPGTVVYADADEDGVGAGEGLEGCPTSGLVTVSGDCSPENPDVYPGNVELCNGSDDNCDGNIDEGLAVRLYRDVDQDGHGDATDAGELVCLGRSVEGKVASNDDCDDSCGTCTPDNDIEIACDGKDDDCNMQVDDGVLTPFLLDCDGDQYLVDAPMQVVMQACAAPALPEECADGAWRLPGDMAAGIDCNDNEARSRPGATEACDGVDNDCDTQSDEGFATAVYYPDCDGDGYARAQGGQRACGPQAVIDPICDRPYRTVPQLNLFADCADDDERAHHNADWVIDQSGIRGEHRVQNLDDQDFDCDGVPEMFPSGSVCAGSACNCYVTTPRCGRTVSLRSTVPFGMATICQAAEVEVSCR